MEFVEGTWLDLPGAEFLVHYLVSGAAALLIAVAIYRWLPNLWGRSSGPPLDGYELAFLAGGPIRVCQTVLASLRHNDLVDVESGGVRLETAAVGDDPEARSEGEREALNAVRLGTQGKEFRDMMKAHVAALERSLKQKGYLLKGTPETIVRAATLLPPILWLALGVGKVFVGLERDRPIGFLLLILLAGVVALYFLGRGAIRSEQGWRLLSSERARNGRSLEVQTMPDSSTVMVSVALFGLSHTDPLRHYFSPFADAGSGSGSGCNSDTGCGGGGDSGCGGCGGD